MARRMFSSEIVSSDAFLDMPSESQLLYFQLGMNADDDGFIANAKMIQRIIGASDDSLKLLVAKKFILLFDKGLMVIKHWRINNSIRKDRYHETKYMKEKTSLFIRENGAYTTNPINSLSVPKGHFTVNDKEKIDVGNQLATNGQPSIGKVRLDKNNIYSKFSFHGKPCRKDNFTKKWKALDNGEWLEIDEKYIKDIK